MYERLNRGTEDALGYRINRPLGRDEVRKIAAEIEGTIDKSGSVRILIDLQSFPYDGLGALWEDLKFDVKFAQNIEKFALVGGGAVESWATRIFGLLTRTACRNFEADKIDDAWEWLTAPPA
jgi:hypothetical protein